MSSLTVECPHCHQPFELTEAIAAPIVEAERAKAMAEAARRVESERAEIEIRAQAAAESKFAEQIQAGQTAIAERDAQLEAAKQAQLAALNAKAEAEQAKRDVELTVRQRVDAQKSEIERQAREGAESEAATKLNAVNEALAAKDAKLKKAEEAELAALHAKAEAEEAKRQVELTVARRLDEDRGKVREQALKERDEEYRLKVAEKDKQLDDLKVKLAEVQRKADQGSQQLKGDVLELDLCDALTSAFPGDEVERVKKGQKGGDVIHTVRSNSGLICGRIKWESKHTQNWIPAWLPKLREDQRAAKCDLAALMSETLPDGITHFDVIDEVWVSGIGTVLPMATALRRGLIETATARRAAAGADSKKDIVYGYLTGSEFRARVRGVIEPIIEMRTSLETEKRSASRQFAVREKQLERMGLSLSGMYGDLQGLVGPSLPAVEGLALPKPDADEAADAPQLEVDDATASGGEVH